MRALFCDLASHHGCIAIVTDQKVEGMEAVDHRIDDAQLISHIEDVFSQSRWSYSDLTHIACVVGPGGFTSLRVAVAFANALSHELKIPLCGVHLSDIYESRIMNHGSRGYVWLHSTKKHELFIRDFAGGEFSEPTCIAVDALKTILQPAVGVVRERPLPQWMGELIPEHRQIITGIGAEEAALRSVEEVLPEFLRHQKYEKQNLQPWYGRGW